MEFGATHKKKNTYIVKVNNLMADMSAFGMCQNTPLPVIVQNGKRVQNGTGAWMRGTNFPNPAAASMQAEFDVLEPVMGEKLASMIIEYLDKDTGRPVLTLFPTSTYVHDGYEKNYMAHLNHASRQDLTHQLKIREQLIDKLIKSRQK